MASEDPSPAPATSDSLTPPAANESPAASPTEANGEAQNDAADNAAEASQEGDGSQAPPPNPPIEGASPCKIFVGGLPKETTDETFKNHFGKYGEITDIVIMKDRISGHPRGFGFVTYKEASSVDQVILESHIIDGKQVEIKRTIPKGAISGKDFKTKKIFVGGIPTSVTDDEFKSFFSKFGEVQDHMIMRDHSTKRSRGFGFITFDAEQSVDDLLIKGNRIEFAGAQVEIKKAEPKKASGGAPSVQPKHFGHFRPAFGRGFKDSYGAPGGRGANAGSYMYGGGFGSRPRAYGGYGGSDLDGVYGGYGSAGMGTYRGESSVGYSGRYGGGFGRGYDLGGYDGPGEGYGGYGSGGAYGSGYDSAMGTGYGRAADYGGGAGYGGGADMYGPRRDYGGSATGRYHPYGR